MRGMLMVGGKGGVKKMIIEMGKFLVKDLKVSKM